RSLARTMAHPGAAAERVPARGCRSPGEGHNVMTVARVILAMALVCFCGCSSDRSKQPVTRQPVGAPTESTPHQFLTPLIRSLATTQGGLKMVNDAAAAKSSMADLMTANQNATIEVRMAEALIEPYVSSRDVQRHDAADGILSAYKMYERSLAIQLAGFE